MLTMPFASAIPENAGKLGDSHVHASLVVIIHGDEVDFSHPGYQVRTSWIHFENLDGKTIHRHASGVDLNYLFNSLDIGINEECITFFSSDEFEKIHDSQTRLCTNDKYSLKYYINNKQVREIGDYVINQGDRILIYYGIDDNQKIQNALSKLNTYEIEPGDSPSFNQENEQSSTVSQNKMLTYDEYYALEDEIYAIWENREDQCNARYGSPFYDLNQQMQFNDCINNAQSWHATELEKIDSKCCIDEGGGCLIATAAFGSEMAPQVQFLRELRDNTVLQTTSGTTFMNGFNQFYYSFSPYVADYERENPVFKEAVKVTLTPLLTSLMLLNYVEIDSEEEMLGYGIGIILMNVGMYFVAPVAFVILLKRRR